MCVSKKQPLRGVLYVAHLVFLPLIVFPLGSGASVPGSNPAREVYPRPINGPSDVSLYAHGATYLRGASYHEAVELGEYPEDNKHERNTSSTLSAQKGPIATYLQHKDDDFLLRDQARDEPTTRVMRQHFRTQRKNPLFIELRSRFLTAAKGKYTLFIEHVNFIYSKRTQAMKPVHL